jgi:D-lactate dehydrogenase
METPAIAFFDTKPYDRKMFDTVNEHYGYDIKYIPVHLTPDTAALANGCVAACIFINDTVDKHVADRLAEGSVKLIACRSAGFNNVNLDAVGGRMKVVRVPAYSPYAVSEHTIGMMICLNRKIHKAYVRAREGNFSINGLMGFDFYGKCAGVIGTGKIGKRTIAILRGMGVNVCGYDVAPDKEFAARAGFTYTDLHTLLSSAEIIILHCPLTSQTRHLIDTDTVAQMKDGVMLVNTGRGALIDSAALIEGLKSRKIGSAALDVYEEESDYFFEDLSTEVISDDLLARLLTFPNVLITAHQGFFTREAMHNIAKTTLQNVKEFIDGRPLRNAVTE